ncbi:MAG TPA: AMP-binding protein [Acidimicrobiia bacterium]|nr:AMP-binding protein [Acidimicrobiia bacterium]
MTADTSSAIRSFGRRIADVAAERPDDVAVVFAATDGTEQPITWAELDRRANQIARAFEERMAADTRGEDDIAPERFVVIALPNSLEHLFSAIAAWRLGACVLPLRSDLPQWERERLVALARPALAVGDWDVRRVPALSHADVRATTSYDTAPVPDRVADPAMAVASGGSTGSPKLIVDTEPGIYDPDASAYQTAAAMGGARVQVQLVPAPLYHTNGFRLAHATLHRGERIVLMERFDAARAVDLIERHSVTTVTMAPTMLLRIARLPAFDPHRLDSLQSVLQGAAPCPPWLVRWWIDRVGAERFFIAYGASERVGITFIRGDAWLEHPGSVGKGLRADVRILDEQRRDVPAGVVGEVFLRPHERDADPDLYRGAPPAPHTDDGFVSVGDLGWLDDDGYLYIADRRADMIVTGGANVFPAEVEAAMSEHPSVADVAVVGVPDDEWGRYVHAVVQPVDVDAPPSPEELRAHCRARLAPYKVPKAFTFVDALPRTDAGKLNRSALADALSSISPS